MDIKDISIMLVGAGNMGGAMMAGWLADGLPPRQLCVLDPKPNPAIGEIISANNICHEKNSKTLVAPDVLLVAVKPQVMGEVLDDIKHLVRNDTLVMSVAAGKTIAFLEDHLGSGSMIRAMSNTPALVQRGITVACANSRVSKSQKLIATKLLGAIGSVEWVGDEGLMDAVTAVSGSGPAYAFHLVEALGDAAIGAGLPERLARKLALETVAGAGELMMRSDLPPGTLRQNVTSPGGTTQAALEVLMGEDGFPQLLQRAVDAAKKRSGELS